MCHRKCIFAPAILKHKYMLGQKQVTKWRRFSRASYATFQSVHRVVSIGVLSVAMLAVADLKVSAMTSEKCYIGPRTETTADDEETDSLNVTLDDIRVTASRVPMTQQKTPRQVSVVTADDIEASEVNSINDLLENIAGVDVRQRGEFGVQTDISVRGGTADQITILLNGINISSPHTGHLTADFPVSLHDIERIEVIKGPSSRIFGTSAFTGVINIVTRQDGRDIHLFGGSYGYVGANAHLSFDGKMMTNTVSGGFSRSDGATPNSYFKSTQAFYQGQLRTATTNVALQAGYSYKPYGANTFYGASSTDQWESNERYMAALTTDSHLDNFNIQTAFAWNRWFDHYQWHKDKPAGENYHQVDTWTASFNGWTDTRLGRSALGVEMRNEGIYSTKLGELMDEADFFDVRGHDGLSDSTQYTHHSNRSNISAFFEHDVLLDRWTISLGVLGNLNTALDYKWRFYPGVDISWRTTETLKLFASWNMALRMPTFTELYYSGSNIVGNSSLEPERNNDISIGAKWRQAGWRAEASLFYGHKTDMIDWVVFTDEYEALDDKSAKTFRSTNFTLDNVGFELSVDWLPSEVWDHCPVRKLGAQYAYISQSSDYHRAITESKYAMEYLRHKVVTHLDTRIWRSLNLNLTWKWQDRVGKGNAAYALLDGRLAWDASRWTIYASCTNILDKEYYDYSYIQQPGRWGKFGLILRL